MDKVEQIIKIVFPHARIVKEFAFCDWRRWRFDYAVWIEEDLKFAVEVEGGVWIGGRHNRPSGFLRDIEKYNTASSLGWLLFRVVPGKEEELLGLLRLLKQEKQNGGVDL